MVEDSTLFDEQGLYYRCMEFSWSSLPFIYLIAINLVAIIFYGSDKLSAISHGHRVRERTLLLIALFGGTIGALAGMQLFHHKTRKAGFQLLFTVILLLQLASAVFIVGWLRGSSPLTPIANF